MKEHCRSTDAAMKSANGIPYIHKKIVLFECGKDEKRQQAFVLNMVYLHGNAENMFMAYNCAHGLAQQIGKNLVDGLYKGYYQISINLYLYEYFKYFPNGMNDLSPLDIIQWAHAVSHDLGTKFELKNPALQTFNICVGYSLGSAFTCSLMGFCDKLVHAYILIAPFASIYSQASKESEVSWLLRIAMLAWNDRKHELFPNIKNIKENSKQNEIIVICSKIDSICGKDVEEFEALEKDRYINPIIYKEYSHEMFIKDESIPEIGKEISSSIHKLIKSHGNDKKELS